MVPYPRDANRKPLPGLVFAGGDLIVEPDFQLTSANLTADPSGMSYYDEAMFLKVMRRTGKVGARNIRPIMPWWFFGQMNDDDLKALLLICTRSSRSTTAWTTANPRGLLPNLQAQPPWRGSQLGAFGACLRAIEEPMRFTSTRAIPTQAVAGQLGHWALPCWGRI